MKIAIVTGASSGMGREFVRQLGYFYKNLDEIWVIARRKERLEALAKESRVPLRIFAGDLQKKKVYKELRDALEKLQLNDAALQFEAETSVALGFGFRCGFLGLLHLEIIQERLEREYNLDLVTTAPSVIYKIHKTNGDVIDLTNPTNMPDPAEIEYMEEPMVKAEIMVTSEYIGAIMDLCQERRGIYQGMEYIEETRAVLTYHLPLNEIIYDFFDALKSRSRGYASLDYELDGYERSSCSPVLDPVIRQFVGKSQLRLRLLHKG